MRDLATDRSARPGSIRSQCDAAPWGGLVVVAIALAASPATAEEDDDSGSSVEVIDHSGDSTEEDSADRSGDDEEASTVETIDHEGDEEADGETTDAGTSPAPSGDTSSFTAGYATGLWVDSRWEGAGEDVVEWRGRFDLQLRQQLSSRWSAVARGEFRYWMGGKERADGPNLLVNAANPRAEAQVRLGETYALYQSDRWSFRAGNLENPWGSTSLIRPGDVVNPVDFTAFAGPADAGDRLIPQPAAELSYVRPNWSLTALVVPFFSGNRVTLFGRDSAIASARNPLLGRSFPVGEIVGRLLDRSIYEEVQPLLASPSPPDERPVNASAGLRWTGTRWNTDFGLGYYFGWDRTPYLEVDSEVRELGRLLVADGQVLRDFDIQDFIARNPEALDLTNSIAEKRRRGRQLVGVEHRRLHSLVADVSRYLGPVGLRADVALHPARTYVTRTFRTVRRPTVFAAAGGSWERFVSDRPFVVTVEGFWLEPLEADAAPTRWFVDAEERGSSSSRLLLFGERYRGLAGALDWTTPVADLQLRLGGIVELDAGGLIVNGEVARRWEPWLRTSLGAVVYEGPNPAAESSLGGLYDRNDRIGLRVSGEF